MVKITFPDGSVREYNEGVTGLQIAESISYSFVVLTNRAIRKSNLNHNLYVIDLLLSRKIKQINEE